MRINFFVRKKYPGYFSIEQLFNALAKKINSRPAYQAAVQTLELPFFLGPLNFFRNIFYVRKQQAPVNHITGDVHYAILGCSSRNLNVLTIHDCVILERHKKDDIRYWIFRILWYELPMRKADLITVISEKTRLDLIQKIGYGEKKIRVVGNFVNEQFTYRPKGFNKIKPELLFIGSTDNKNLNRILKAIVGLPCRLQIVGKISAQQATFIQDNKIEAMLSFELSLEELAEKYSTADIVLFPSLYEGFGMLIIEANAAGRPVVTSNIAPMPEIAGKAAAFVDPLDVHSIRKGIDKVIEDDAFRQSIIEEGFNNARLYSLDNVAEKYLGLYQSFLQMKARKNI